ncbi:LysM peptidoglycan-binding domain-containing protein [Tenacibaculum sp. M341]|uniref:LysM peptidoglycan-binding domain-containing protein n=1 Tax=Tenacibaculum sp. M341 TaxID=2530339 RepID=UPI00104C60A6|nr:LysM peptidoglycan-binding domain-containing protein [Tenacibaculum sp. M341]TCI94885.1 LysM peptidoglycan-binding domain-containing protein [Tenacibaculum sp. M341]
MWKIIFFMLLVSRTVFSQDKKLPEGWDPILLDGKTAYMNLITGDVSETFPLKAAKKKEIVEEYDPTITHKVMKGETLSSISRKYNMHLSRLYRLNSMVNFDSIEVGDEIVIGYKEKNEVLNRSEVPEQVSEDSLDISKYHIVKSGDTLYSIAKKYGISVSILKEKNNLKSNSIFVGQQLLIQ